MPPDAHRIACWDGETALTGALRDIGFEIAAGEAHVDDEPPPDAVLVAGGRADAAQRAARGAAIATSGVAVVAVGPSASPSLRPVPRLTRGLELLASPFSAMAVEFSTRRVARAMRRRGLHVTRVVTGDRSHPRYGVGAGGWIRRRRLPGGSIVIGSTGRSRSSIVDEAVNEAAKELGRPLSRRSADVFPSGKLALELVDPDRERYFLSLAAGHAGRGLGRSESAVRAVLGAEPPAAVRERILVPLASGRIGPVRYVLEPKAAGGHPLRMTPRLWDDSLEFLVALHELPHRAANLSLPRSWPDLDTAVEILGRHSSPDEVALLERLRAEIARRMEGIEAGAAHGDFFTQNLLVRGGRLRTVLDWEWAAADALPLLDLMDLRAQLGWRRRRGLRVGENFTDVLWPLALRGGDEPMRRYCRAIGASAEPAILEGLAFAHWLLRTARLGSIDPRRLDDRGWVLRNVAAPLARVRETLGRTRARGLT